MCTKKEVTMKTLIITAIFKRQDPKLFEPKSTLKGLGWDDQGLSFLAMSLRALIGDCASTKSIYSRELRKKKFSINSLVKLMILRIFGDKHTDVEIKNFIIGAQGDM